jgi:hypothetical protein
MKRKQKMTTNKNPLPFFTFLSSLLIAHCLQHRALKHRRQYPLFNRSADQCATLLGSLMILSPIVKQLQISYNSLMPLYDSGIFQNRRGVTYVKN